MQLLKNIRLNKNFHGRTDGRLTYLWGGYEHEYGKYDFENNKKIGDENI